MPEPVRAFRASAMYERAGGPASRVRRDWAFTETWAFDVEYLEFPTPPVHDWLPAVTRRLKDLASLPDGWTGSPNSVPPTAPAVIGVIECMHHLADTVGRLPAIVSGSDGSLGLEWHYGGVDAEIEVNAAGHVEDVFLRDLLTGREAEFDHFPQEKHAISEFFTAALSREVEPGQALPNAGGDVAAPQALAAPPT